MIMTPMETEILRILDAGGTLALAGIVWYELRQVRALTGELLQSVAVLVERDRILSRLDRLEAHTESERP